MRLVVEVMDSEERKTGANRGLPEGNPQALVLYVALASYTVGSPGKPVPSLASTEPVWWTGDQALDRELLLTLYDSRLIAIARETPPHAFRLSESSGEITFVCQDAAWRLVDGLPTVQQRVQEITHNFQAHGPQGAEMREALALLVDDAEVANVAEYLNGLLTMSYGYPEVPEARQVELTDVIRIGFTHGYTPGLMICFAWRAADSAAAWKERNARMGPAAGSFCFCDDPERQDRQSD